MIAGQAEPSPAEWIAAESVDDRALRNLFGTFLTGVTIITLREPDGAARGLTANSFTSVSLNPPLILVCVANSAGSHSALCEAKRFGVNVLSDRQKDASAAFASRSGQRFDAVATEGAPDGPPFIVGSLSMFDCGIEQVIAAGDHTIVVGRVLGFRLGSGRPLGYYRGGYVAFELGADALEHLGGEAIRVGCLIEYGDRVLLVRRNGSKTWDLPNVPLRAGEDHRQVLPRMLVRLGVRAEVDFLYSVFQEKGDPHTTLIFRGVAEEIRDASGEPEGIQIGLFSREDQPWKAVTGQSQVTVLRRFYKERDEARFGIYWDTEDGGRIASLVGTPRRWANDPNLFAASSEFPPEQADIIHSNEG